MELLAPRRDVLIVGRGLLFLFLLSGPLGLVAPPRRCHLARRWRLLLGWHVGAQRPTAAGGSDGRPARQRIGGVALDSAHFSSPAVAATLVQLEWSER
jgi:hypothetical protein